MTDIFRLTGQDAYDLIYPDHLAILSVLEQETMHRAMTNSSRVWVGEDDGRVLAVWGLIPPTLMSDRAYLWLYTTEYLKGHTFTLIRHSQRAIQAMLEDYPTIVGHGRIGSTRSLQWLRWLGAEFGEPIDDKIIPFTIRAKQWRQDSAQSA